MNIDPAISVKIHHVIDVFETGHVNPDYAAHVIQDDGPGGCTQITYGKLQTTEYGNLAELVQSYVDNGGKYADALRPFIPMIGKQSLAKNQTFVSTLIAAGSDPVMGRTQETFFDKRYWAPMSAFADANGFTLNLSILVLFDSYIQSGSILHEIRNTFPESVPASGGGDEKAWVTAYVNARKSFIANHPNPLVRETVYRMNTMLTILAENDWDLKLPIKACGNIIN